MKPQDPQDSMPTGAGEREYEPPVVEDIDTSHGPLVTPAGSVTGVAAVPRDV